MGLAGTKVKQRFGLDPRNTAWSNNTDRFGHQYLQKLGWNPGDGLGLVDHATTTHVKVSIKTDNAGLGAKLSKKTKKDEFDSGECAGLDVFQRILGRLNGKEEQISNELERQRLDKIINGKWGMHFVKGETLRSTWDTECKTLTKPGESRQKRRLSEVDEASRKKLKKEKKDKKDKKDKKEKKEGKVKKDKKDKKEKKEKKEKKDKKVKKDRKDKQQKKEEVTRESMLKPKEKAPEQIATRLSARAKWIRQKRASVMDAKALNEIFMITN